MYYKYIFVYNKTVMETQQQIQLILNDIHEIFRNAVGQRNRREYMRENNIPFDINYSFSLSADDIINNKIPARVAGCTGIAKVFCKYAATKGMECYVLATANYKDWLAAKAGGNNIINGHQIIAVEKDGKLCAFDPGRKELKWIDGVIEKGRFIEALAGRPKYLIGAITPRDDFVQCNEYRKIRNLYTSGSMDNSEFLIVPL